MVSKTEIELFFFFFFIMDAIPKSACLRFPWTEQTRVIFIEKVRVRVAYRQKWVFQLKIITINF